MPPSITTTIVKRNCSSYNIITPFNNSENNISQTNPNNPAIVLDVHDNANKNIEQYFKQSPHQQQQYNEAHNTFSNKEASIRLVFKH